MSFEAPEQGDLTIPSHATAKELGKVNVRPRTDGLEVQFTILMAPQGREAEGWQTGVALDASTSMKGQYGRRHAGDVPREVAETYERRGWVRKQVRDGREVSVLRQEAYDDAVRRGHLRPMPNVVEPLARDFVAFLARELDAGAGTEVIYWACGDGGECEPVGSFTAERCAELVVAGPAGLPFGTATKLTPAVRHFAQRFRDARHAMCVFVTDGRLDDLDDLKAYTRELAAEVAAGTRRNLKCVLVGVGEAIDVEQLQQLDDFDSGHGVDLWDFKVAKEMRDLLEIFAEVVDESYIVAPSGTVYASDGSVARRFTDGVPAKVSVSLPAGSAWFELEVGGRRIRQELAVPARTT